MVTTRSRASKNVTFEENKSVKSVPKQRVNYKKVVYDGKKDASSDEELVEVEECRVCFKFGKAVMIECDDCLGGFHLKCLKPPLKDVPEEDWICGFCEAHKLEGKKLVRTLREKLLSSDLWAAHIESIWKEVDGSYWCRVHWYIIPKETAAGRQPHNLWREIYRTNDFADIEVAPKDVESWQNMLKMECILRHCFVTSPKEYAKASNEGDDVFLCKYEYDIHWHIVFQKLMTDDDEAGSDEDWKVGKDSDFDSEKDMNYDEESIKSILAKPFRAHELAANSQKGRFFGLQKIGMKKILEEMLEITTFIKDSISDDKCLGRCLYIHGVPGTGKTRSVLAIMKNLRSEVDAGSIRPYCFVEINGLKLVSPENIYRVIYEALSGHRVGWKKALHLLNKQFSEGKKIGKEDDKPCILLVRYNILDWPTKPHSKLVVIGIANTMDLPEKLLPRISSRMGIQRLCFGPYNYQQLEEIVSSHLKGINAFKRQAIEFASRKATISGDARRALEICRRAAEITDYRLKKLTSTPNDASEGKTLVGMAELALTVSCLCTSNGEAFSGHDTLLKIGCKLGECRIILCESGAKHRLQKLQLNFPSDDVAFALKDNKEPPWLAKTGQDRTGLEKQQDSGLALAFCTYRMLVLGSRRNLMVIILQPGSRNALFPFTLRPVGSEIRKQLLRLESA
ncbi:hypothetical protein DVH24_002401 [Malus domestica]|uniref:Origin recognition complex subunit 1 n=1 Tax=Malus domestica TaxID=3750 RepID=A0A498IHP9_MALDO|nr:hypothetical protein DVH24_002401 [Malus domestica]